MTQTQTSFSQTQSYWEIPGSILLGKFQFAKDLVTWEGHDVSQMNDSDFLREGAWQDNLRLLSANNIKMPISSLTTKKIYSQLNKDSYIAEGFSSVKAQKEAMTFKAYMCWVRSGVIIGITYAFFKQFLLNFNCLEKLSETECQILMSENIAQPATLAKISFAAGMWITTGFLLYSLGKFGLYGYLKEKQQNDDLFHIYKTTANSARATFWKAVEEKDELTARSIYKQVKAIKNNFYKYKQELISYLEIKESEFEKKIRPFDVLMEDLLSQKIDVLFTNLEETIENKVIDSDTQEQVIDIQEEKK
jgi:hypothetical protein